MRVTDVRIRRLTQDNKMKAIVSVTFNESFVIHDIRIIEGSNGLFLAMPSKRTPSGEFRDFAHPINAETRALMQQSILEVYARVLDQPVFESIHTAI